jgi:hypothetical protein
MPERNGAEAEGPSSKVAVAHSPASFHVHCSIVFPFTIQLILNIARTVEI